MALSIEDLLLGTDDQLATPEKAAALAGALKGQRNYGLLGQLMNLEPTRNVGNALVGQADAGLKMGVAQQEKGLGRAAQAERYMQESEWRRQESEWRRQEAEMNRQRHDESMGIQRQRIGVQQAARDLAQSKYEEEAARREREAERARYERAAAARSALAQAEDSLQTMDKLLAHPGRRAGTGLSEWRRAVPSSAARGFGSLHDQVTNKAFMEAFETLKGGGQITNLEGIKATSAMTRLATPYLSEEEYEAAAQELRTILARGVERARADAEFTGAISAQGSSPDNPIPLD